MVGLGLSVGAVLHGSASAQADTARARRDSVRVKGDTTKIAVPARPTGDSILRDSLAMEEIVRSNGLEWTIARPPRLTQDDYLTYRSREDAAPKMGFTLSRKAVAAFMLDAIEQHEHVHKIVGIAK